jgi:hypothetical protein
MIGLPLGDVQGDPEIGPDIVSEASRELANMDTFVGNWARTGLDLPFIDASWEKGAVQDLNGRGPKLAPEELNKKYQNVEKPFTAPMSEMAAMHLNDEGKRRQDLRQAIEEGPGSDFYKGAVNFAQGIVAHALDPVEFGVGAFSGAAFSKAGALLSKSASPLLSKAGQVLAKEGFVYDAVEGVAGNAALEPFMKSSAEEAQINYDLGDSAMNVLGGGLAFPALKFAGKSILKTLPNSTAGLAVKSAMGQIFAGKKPDVSFVKQAYDDLAYNVHPEAKMGPVRTEYSYLPKTADELKASPIFVASKQAGTLEGGSRPVGDLHFGDEGLYITDNPNAANNIAAHPLNTDGPAGDVFSGKLDNAHLLDLDTTGKEIIDELNLPDDLKHLIADADSTHSAYEILVDHANEHADDAPVKEFMAALHAKGYDGFKYSDDVQGHNSAYIFPESKSKVVTDGHYESDVSSLKSVDQEKASAATEKIMSDENDMYHDPEAKQHLEESVVVEPKDVEVEAKKTYDETVKVLDQLVKHETIKDADTIRAIEKIKEDKARSDQVMQVINDYKECLLSGVD